MVTRGDELFTLGIGHYSETDVKESARAFTGYRIDLERQQFRFDSTQHDETLKTFLGRSGNFSGDDILARPTAAVRSPMGSARQLFAFACSTSRSKVPRPRKTVSKARLAALVKFSRSHANRGRPSATRPAGWPTA
ncbi:MAG: DUF1800 family protein [Chthoniobacterales bacterium]|nr:DUF1800 family protein [Chthoniobacterales bacterium]